MIFRFFSFYFYLLWKYLLLNIRNEVNILKNYGVLEQFLNG